MSQSPRQLLIIWHSVTGGAQAMAAAVAQGAAAEPTVEIRLLKASDACADDLLAADGYVFICPEMLAGLSGIMKDFFDRTYYAVLDRIQGRPCHLMVCAGSDGSNAVRQMQRIATGWRVKEIAQPLVVCTRAQTPQAILHPKTLTEDELAACRLAGETLATGLSVGLF